MGRTTISNQMLADMIAGIQADIRGMKNDIADLQMQVNRKPAPERKAVVKDVEFTKANGEVIMASQAQVDAWTENKARLDATKFDGVFTSEMDAWIIANSVCSCKDFKAQFSDTHGLTRDQLKAHKSEMRASGLMK